MIKDEFGCLSVANFGFGYMENTHLQNTLTYPNGMVKTIAYEPNRDLISSIENKNGSTQVSKYAYENDVLGRRVELNSTYENMTKNFDYGYNARSEVTSANQTGNTNYQYGFNYDNIGNRISANENGSNKNYITNNLNQYTSNTGFIPSYDLDGNQKKIKTSTGEWEVTYNGENRPVKFIQGDKTLEMKYDYMGRRVELLSKEGSLVRKHNRFMYKDYTLIQELSNTNTVSSAFIWDPTAGMATKPLIFKYNNSAFYYTHDGNKNVTELISSDNSNLVCHYEYSPFGQTVVSAMTSPQPIPGFIFTYPAYNQFNPFRFSSEYHDDELGLIYYNYRHYNPTDGKWINRDPIQEYGGYNLYGFVKNSSINHCDIKGLLPWNLWDLDSYGLEIFLHWLRGSGNPFIREDGAWGEYMKNNKILKNILSERVDSLIGKYMSKGCGTYIEQGQAFDVEIENGYYSGYELLHGTNARVGGFQMTGIRISVSKDCAKTCVSGTITYTWNDIIDPNELYDEDTYWANLFKKITKPKDYFIKISWTSSFKSCVFEFGGESYEGYPLE